MSHEIFSRHERPQGSTNREFGLVFGTFFLLLAALDYFSKLPPFLQFSVPFGCPFLSVHAEWAGYARVFLFAAISLVFFLFALILPKALASLNWVWTQFGLLLHKIVSPIVLGFLFFVVFTPIGILMRLFGADPLSLRFDSQSPSYWIPRTQPKLSPDSLKDQF